MEFLTLCCIITCLLCAALAAASLAFRSTTVEFYLYPTVDVTAATMDSSTGSVSAKEQSSHPGGRPSPKSLAAVDAAKSSVASKSSTKTEPATLTMKTAPVTSSALKNALIQVRSVTAKYQAAASDALETAREKLVDLQRRPSPKDELSQQNRLILRVELNATRDEKNAMEHHYNDSLKYIETIKKEYDEVKKFNEEQLAVKSGTLTSVYSDLERLKEENWRQERQCKELKREMEELKRLLDELERLLEELERQLEELERQLEELER